MEFTTVGEWFSARLEAAGSPRYEQLREELQELGAEVSATTLTNWKHGHGLPRPQHLAVLFEFFAVGESERDAVRLCWMRQREAANAA